MLFALLIIILRKLKLIEDSNHLNLCPRSVSVFALSCSIIGIGSYAIFGSFCPNPKYCNEIHPYIVFIPVSENTLNLFYKGHSFQRTSLKIQRFFCCPLFLSLRYR